MTRLIQRRLYAVALALLVVAAACGREATSDAPPPVAARPSESAATTPVRQPDVAPPSAVLPAAGPSVAVERPAGPGLVFTDARTQAKEFIAYYRSIKLTPEQERIKVEALAALKAPCCATYSLATCCCPCNMSKSAWGMAAWLITEKGFGVEDVRQAAVDWIEFINPNGFSGDACFTGGCNRPFEHNGCGGMKESELL